VLNNAERQLAELREKMESDAPDGRKVTNAQHVALREKHERLVARLREPSKEMMEAARGHLTTHGIFTSMSTVALRDSEGGE